MTISCYFNWILGNIGEETSFPAITYIGVGKANNQIYDTIQPLLQENTVYFILKSKLKKKLELDLKKNSMRNDDRLGHYHSRREDILNIVLYL